MLIRQVDDIFPVMEKLGMHRTVTPYSTVYTFHQGRGKGSVTLTGTLDWWYYLEMDYQTAQDFQVEYAITEPFISIGITDHISADYQPAPGSEGFSVDVSFFINTEGMHGCLTCPAGQRQRRRSIVIRPGAYSQYLFPALMNYPSNDMLALIRDAGQLCRPYIAKAVTAFQLSGYKREALKMQLNALIIGLFTELIHQADQGPDGRNPEVAIPEADRSGIGRAQEILRENLLAPPTIDALSRQVAMNRKKLQVLFQATTGMTIGDYTRACRMERAMELLATDMLIRDIAHAIGYASPGRFSKAFEAMVHMTPTQYRESLIQSGHPYKKSN